MRKVSRWVVAIVCAGTVGGVGMAAQAPPQAPPTARKVEVLWPVGAVQQWQGLRRFLEQMADKMPAEFYSFRPTPEMRTFAGSMAHIISANVNQCGNLLGRKHALMGQPLENTLTQKADVISTLR